MDPHAPGAAGTRAAGAGDPRPSGGQLNLYPDNGRRRLCELEAIVETGLKTFVDVGRALMEIRDARLYRETHTTFEDYCRGRWGMERAQAYRQIDSARVAEVLSPIGAVPANEAQARELAPLLREDEQRVVEVWREAKETYGAENITALNLRALIGNRARRRQREQEIRQSSAHGGPPKGDSFQLIHGDLLDVEIPWAVDVIICDPPYPTDFLDCYAKLSELGARVLPEGGSVVAMAAQHKLMDVHERMERHLDFVWELAWLFANGAKQRYWKRQVFNTWKPVLWYANGEPQVNGARGSWIRDSILNIGSPIEDKSHHRWGQSVSGMRELVEMFSRPGDTILDPFVGGGSTAIAALETGRRFVGIDIDEQAIATTAARIAELAPAVAEKPLNPDTRKVA